MTSQIVSMHRSNNTNKLSPQELNQKQSKALQVQIIQINLVLKNTRKRDTIILIVQIIQINLVLKNLYINFVTVLSFK